MKNILFVLFSLLILSCSQQTESSENFVSSGMRKISINVFGKKKSAQIPLPPAEYIRWIEDEGNGLRVKKEIADYEFILQYKPLDYVVLHEYKRKKVNKSEFESGRKEYEGIQYYTLRIQSKLNKSLLRSGINARDEEFARLEYFSFHMQNDLQLIEGKDTLPCVLHHFERTYNITPYSDFVIGFEESMKANTGLNDKTLLYNDKALNLGIIKLKIKKEDIQNTPKLIYKTNESES